MATQTVSRRPVIVRCLLVVLAGTMLWIGESRLVDDASVCAPNDGGSRSPAMLQTIDDPHSLRQLGRLADIVTCDGGSAWSAHAE